MLFTNELYQKRACVCTCMYVCMCVRGHSHVCVCWLLALGLIRTRQAVYQWIVQIVPSTHVLKPLESNFLLSFSFFWGGGGRKSLFHPTACPSSSEVRAGIWRVISNLLFLGVALAVPELTLQTRWASNSLRSPCLCLPSARLRVSSVSQIDSNS